MKLYAYRVCARGTRRVYRNHCHCVIVSPFLCMCLCSFIPRCKGTKFSGQMQAFPQLFLRFFKQRELCVNSKRIMRANPSNYACKLFGCRLQTKSPEEKPRSFYSGENRIRTCEPVLPVTRFPGVPLQPLEHLSFVISGCKITKKRGKYQIKLDISLAI